ncbi:MAG: TetR/AcrR family transcriptional regulator [Pseudomonadota bacterium]
MAGKAVSHKRPGADRRTKRVQIAQVPAGRRLSSDKRADQIIEAAIDYFAEVGLDGNTRDLAQRIGITQPLLYKYFPSKDDLVDAIFDHLFVNRWQPEWDDWLGEPEHDPDWDLGDRLFDFYQSYADYVFRYDWSRLFMFNILTGREPNRAHDFMALVQDRIIDKICQGLRATRGLPPPSQSPLTDQEREIAWAFHGGLFYLTARRDIYGLTLHAEPDDILKASIDRFLNGVPAALDRIGR